MIDHEMGDASNGSTSCVVQWSGLIVISQAVVSNAKPSPARIRATQIAQKQRFNKKGAPFLLKPLIQRFEGSGGRILALNTPLFGTFFLVFRSIHRKVLGHPLHFLETSYGT
jgi:hypothetical protein